MKRTKAEVCPNCGTVNPLTDYHYRYALEQQRYRYPNYARLLEGMPVRQVLGYVLENVSRGWSSSIDSSDFDGAFREWLEWHVDATNDPTEEEEQFESKRTSDNSWLSRCRTRFLKRCLLECGCRVEFELAREDSARHIELRSVNEGCAAHGSITGWAMDMKGRCYVCEWPITPQAKSVDSKINRLDPTYHAVAL